MKIGKKEKVEILINGLFGGIVGIWYSIFTWQFWLIIIAITFNVLYWGDIINNFINFKRRQNERKT